ncbi:MAG: hypothetical protein ACYDEY_02610 [Acidimicrobiales bacterium]
MLEVLILGRIILITRPEQYNPEALVSLLQKQTIATMDELKATLGTNADATVFRKLAALGYRTSYSHRGRYYTLDEVSRFDALGLWSFRAVYFSKFGTLVATAEALAAAAEAGYDAGELAALLHVDVGQPLLKLVRSKRLSREQVSGRYVYLSPEPSVRRAQLRARSVYDAEASRLSLGSGFVVLPDELKAAIVLFYSLLDERQRRLYAGLEAMKVGHGGDAQVAELFGIDPGTVARGRVELLSGDVPPGRVRRPKGGRRLGKKAPPRP